MVAWLERVYARALELAGLSPATTPAEVVADVPDRIACYAEIATLRCDELAVLDRVTEEAERAGTPHAAELRAAIVRLAMDAAYEHAIATDLIAVVPTGFEPMASHLARERAAEAVIDQWEALGAVDVAQPS